VIARREKSTAQPAGAEAKGTMRDDCIYGRESKVFELLEGGAAARKPGRRKLNVFARWAVSEGLSLEDDVSGVFLEGESYLNTVRMSLHCILDTAERPRLELAA